MAATHSNGDPGVGSDFSVYTQRQHGVAIVSLAGELDLAGVPTLERELARVAQDPAVVLDLARVTFMDCSGLRCLLAARKASERQGRPFEMIGGSRPVRRVFSLTGYEELLQSGAAPGLLEVFALGPSAARQLA